MPKLNISLILALASFTTSWFLYQETEEIIPESSIDVLISERNKTESFEFPYIGEGIPYRFLRHSPLVDIPKDTLCKPKRKEMAGNEKESKFWFECGWKSQTPDFDYTLARFSVSLPANDTVHTWKFNRANLQIQPLMWSWSFYNFGTLLGSFLFGFVGIMICVTVVNAQIKVRKRILT